MEGRSHLLVGLTAGVVLDSVVHLTGDPLTMAKVVPLTLVVKKIVYYFMVGFGSLLPDIDNARSTLGHKLGWLLGSLIALGLEQLVAYLLYQQGFTIPARFVNGTHLVFYAVLFGCIMHIVADAMTEGGVPLLWPNHKRFGIPPNPHWRFRTGTWPEFVIVWSFMILVGIGIWQSIIVI